MNNVNISINLPQSDIALMRQLGDRMGWHVNDVSTTDALYDPESGKCPQLVRLCRYVKQAKGARV